MLFLEYPKCSTCQRAKKWLEEHHISFEDRHIVEQNPSAEEIEKWQQMSGQPIKKFFNTSGLIYKNENIKEKLAGMSDKEQMALLAERGMLVKRPLIIGEDYVLIGFKEKEWSECVLRHADGESV